MQPEETKTEWPVVQWPNEILDEELPEVPDAEFNDDSLRKLVNVMTATIEDHDGLGLAANQIGVRRRVIVVRHPTTGVLTTMVNPEIKGVSTKESIWEEGCLSIYHGRTTISVSRPKNIVVKFSSPDGSIHDELRYSGLEARIILHEIDHLNGLTILATASKVAVGKAKSLARLLKEGKA